MENILEWTEKIMEIAKNDEEIAKKTKKTNTTLTLTVKGTEDVPFGIALDNGAISFSRGELPDAEYEVEMSEQSYEDFLDGKIAGLKMMKAITIVKGSLMGMRKLMPVFDNLPRIAQELKGSQIEMVA